ncbi:MAG TPA: phage tail sheath C-terminal domain-containing protein, partial [Longimicrobiales bacterium]|nr:phage tail sheath C-terminal domain-containing protein [Longimicrobiales bacterium]
VLEVDDLTPGETDALNQAQVNPVVSSNGGVVLWGGRTLTVDPEVTYIAVQRLAMHVDARVRQTLDWATGEASDSALWDAARADVEALLDGLWRDGAFQGSRTQDAYFVRSDHTTHTDDDIQAGRLNVVVGFAALRPAEFVVRRVTIEL